MIIGLDGESRICHAQVPRQQQDLLCQTSSSNHQRGLPAFHRLQSARLHRVPIRTRRLILRGETYETFHIETQLIKGYKRTRLTPEVIGPVPLE